MADEEARMADRLEAARWLADWGFGKSLQSVALEAREGVDVQAFAAFAAKYLPSATLDELILGVEAKIEAERALDKYDSNVAELAPSGEIPFVAWPEQEG